LDLKSKKQNFLRKKKMWWLLRLKENKRNLNFTAKTTKDLSKEPET
jgi:hypothetical protein